jgi:hypothetical protein
MNGESDKPLTEEELALARDGEKRIAAAVAEVQAPQALRESIERTRAQTQQRTAFWHRARWALAAAGTAAVALAAVAILDNAGTQSGSPSLDGVYAAAEREPAQPAPAQIGGTPPVLDARVGAIEFPDWKQKFGWRAVGRRDTEVADRRVTTVAYRNPDGARLGYAIVGGEPLSETPPGGAIRKAGDTYHLRSDAGRTTVTWTQQGHTCVIVAPDTVPRGTLLALAASRNTDASPRAS